MKYIRTQRKAGTAEEAVNDPARLGKAVSLVAEMKEGESSFRIRIAPPEGKSFARNIAEKYGVTYEHLTGGEGTAGTGRAPE